MATRSSACPAFALGTVVLIACGRSGVTAGTMSADASDRAIVKALVGALCLAVAAMGCSASAPPQHSACTPGAMQECACSNGVSSGAQRCSADGSGYLPCECFPPGPPPTNADAGAD
jgi:hypothetical protein